MKPSEHVKMSMCFPVGCTVAVQCVDGGPWIHAVIEKVNSSDHRGRSYKCDKNRYTKNMEHICSTPSNYRSVSVGTDKEENLVVRGHFYADSSTGAEQSTWIACSRSEGTCESWEYSNE